MVLKKKSILILTTTKFNTENGRSWWGPCLMWLPSHGQKNPVWRNYLHKM